jgi:hypothetical protein
MSRGELSYVLICHYLRFTDMLGTRGPVHNHRVCRYRHLHRGQDPHLLG